MGYQQFDPIARTITRSDRQPTLDFLRGVAVLSVVAFHAFPIFGDSGGPLSLLASFGFYGVQLFFLVSAMTMCYMWDARLGEGGATVNFYIRRFFRIAPPFWIALAAYATINGPEASMWAPNGVGWPQVLTTIFLMHNFWPATANSIVPGGWSIGVEVCFYVLFPVLAFIRFRPLPLLLLAAATYGMNLLVVVPLYNWLFGFYAYPQALIREFLYFQFFNQLPVFLIGMALFQVIIGKASVQELLWSTIFAGFWLVIAFYLKISLGVASSPVFWLVIILMCVLIFLSFFLEISISVVGRFGQLSYAIYLSHFGVIQFVEYGRSAAGLPGNSSIVLAIAFSSVLLLCFVVASISEAFIEKPLQAAAKKLIYWMSLTYSRRKM